MTREPAPFSPVAMVIRTHASHLLDERSDPDFRAVYGALLGAAERLDVAIQTPRLAGVTLGPAEIARPSRIRMVLANLRVLTTTAEAEALSATARGRATLSTLIDRFDEGSLEVRTAPLAGWSPDFSVFHGRDGSRHLMMGLHWFVHPYPHPGPALAAILSDVAADHIAARFDALWGEAHDITPPVRRIFRRALDLAPGIHAEQGRLGEPVRPLRQG